MLCWQNITPKGKGETFIATAKGREIISQTSESFIEQLSQFQHAAFSWVNAAA